MQNMTVLWSPFLRVLVHGLTKYNTASVNDLAYLEVFVNL